MRKLIRIQSKIKTISAKNNFVVKNEKILPNPETVTSDCRPHVHL